jgi:hypothetical protein
VCRCIFGAAVLLEREGSGRCGPAGAALLGQEGSGDAINYDNEDSRQRHQRAGAETTTSNKSGCLTTQGNNDGVDNSGRDVTLRASYSQLRPLRV